MQTVKKQTNLTKVLPLGPFIVDEKHAVNVYVYSVLQSHVLIDLSPIQSFESFRQEIEKQVLISELTHIVLMNIMLSTIPVLERLIEEGFKGILITNYFIARQIENAKLNLQIAFIENLHFHLSFGEQAEFQFIPIQFLPYPEMFMTIDLKQGTLFSGLVMSSYISELNQPGLTELQKAIFTFHKEMMPSSQYLKPVMTLLEKYAVNLVLPTYGYLIDRSMTPFIMEYMRKIDFHNSYLMSTKSGLSNENLDYIHLINQLLAALEKNFSRIEILNTFVGSPFHLDSETLMLKKTSLVSYKLWHQFFEHVFAKKGMSWLIIMEPVLNHLMKTYEIERPSIYRTETIKLQEEARKLEEKRTELENHLFSLKKEIEEAKDNIVKDPLTKLYNQDMLKHMMKEHFAHPVTVGTTRGLMLIQLDQLPEINKRYDKETGDETVRNMVYVIDQVKDKDVMIFKQSGPGIFALVDGQTKENIIKEAVVFRNSIEKSTSFIEKMSISIAIVTCEEVDPTLDLDDKMKYLLQTIEKRMGYAKIKGPGQIIDETVAIPTQAVGYILLVDQDEINRNMLYRIFKRINYDVIVADSVVEAYQIIQKRKIDVVISEINLSKMDGFQLKMMMNESKTYHDIPFIMVSHNKTIDNIRRGNLLDVDLILEKPIVPEELIGHVKRMKGNNKS